MTSLDPVAFGGINIRNRHIYDWGEQNKIGRVAVHLIWCDCVFDGLIAKWLLLMPVQGCLAAAVVAPQFRFAV